MKTFVTLSVAAFALLSTNVRADEDGSFVGYDSIVNELKESMNEKPPIDPASDDWQEVAMHGGIALATSWVSLNTPNGAAAAGLLKGIEVSFGMNMFSRNWRAEAAFGSYAPEQLSGNFKASLKEFELRAIYTNTWRDNYTYRMGTGMAARSMQIDSSEYGRWASYESSTPTWMILAGFERKLGPNVGIGPDLSLRNSMVGDSYEKTAWNMAFRLNATF